MKITDYKETFIDSLEYRIQETLISEDGTLEDVYIQDYENDYLNMVRNMVTDLGYDPNLLDLTTLDVTFYITGKSHNLANQIYNEYESKIDNVMENEDYESEEEFAYLSGADNVLYMMGNPSIIDEVLKHPDELNFSLEVEPYELEDNLAINNPESSIPTIAHRLEVAFDKIDFENWLYDNNPDGYLDNVLHEYMREEQVLEDTIRNTRYTSPLVEFDVTDIHLNVDLEEFAETHLDRIKESGSISNYVNQFYNDLFYQNAVDINIEIKLDDECFLHEGDTFMGHEL